MEVLTREQFELLTSLERGEDVSVVNAAVLANTESLGWVKDGRLTESGRAALEPYRVKRAILLAAGLGNRMLPLTETTPKPMVKVHGTPIIETLINALEAVGIPEIVIVTGHLASAFEDLKTRHPSLTFIHNPHYLTQNNISSAYLVKDRMANAYVLEADLYLSNPAILRKYEFETNYLGFHVDQTDDWRFMLDGDRIVWYGQGGTDCYQMIGISYWTASAAATFAKDAEIFYATDEGKTHLWDDLPLIVANDHYDIRVRPCQASDIVEIDSVRELATIDATYLPILKELK